MITATLTYANHRRLRKYELFYLNKLLKYCINKPTSNNKIKEILDGKTITKRIKVQRINYWGHIHRRNPEHILKNALAYNAGAKKLGRPCFTWQDSLNQDLAYFNRPIEEWVLLLTQRTELRKAAEEVYLCSESDSSDLLEDENVFILY